MRKCKLKKTQALKNNARKNGKIEIQKHIGKIENFFQDFKAKGNRLKSSKSQQWGLFGLFFKMCKSVIFLKILNCD